MNTIYLEIHKRAKVKHSPDMSVEETFDLWFKTADDYKQELIEEGLFETVLELDKIVDMQECLYKYNRT